MIIDAISSGGILAAALCCTFTLTTISATLKEILQELRRSRK